MSVSRLVLIAIVGLVGIGCLGERQRPPCDCPNMESIVPTLDWFGDGSTPNTVDSAGPVDPAASDQGPEVEMLFNHFTDLDEARAGLDDFYEALVAAGLIEQAPPDMTVGFLFDLTDASVTVTPPLVEENQPNEIVIDVTLLVSDEDAAAALRPLVDALGTTD